MRGLIDTFPPEGNEGPVDYFRRLALRNGYSSWHALVRAAGVNPTANALWKCRDNLARTLGLAPEWIASALPDGQAGTGLYDSFFERPTTDPICPSCLVESEYMRHAWSHYFVTACPEHQCQLVDRCPSCLTALENGRHGIAVCDCGFDLRYAEASPASSIHRWVSARIGEDMRPIDGIEEIGKPDDYRLLAKLLFQLTVRYDAAVTARPAKVSRPKTIAESNAFLEPVFHMLEDFRPRFSAHVAHRFSTGSMTAFGLSGRLGAWYTNLHKLCTNPAAFSLVWEVFSDAVLENFDGVLRGQKVLTPTMGKERTYLALAEAARYIGISRSAMQVAIEREQVSSRVSRQGVNYCISMILREDCERVRAVRAEWVPEFVAAERLGVAESILQNIVCSGVLNFDPDWRDSVFKSGPCPINELAALVERLSGFLQIRNMEETLKFNQLTARRTVDIKALTALYQAIFRGEVRPIGRDAQPGLGGFIFSSLDVKRYLGSAALPDALTLTQLEKATGWKYECLSRWTELKLLESEMVVLQGRMARVVTVRALSRFRKEWLPVSDIASSVGSKGSAITRRLENLGITIFGQTNPQNGPRRGGLIRLGDLSFLAGLSDQKSTYLKPVDSMENTIHLIDYASSTTRLLGEKNDHA